MKEDKKVLQTLTNEELMDLVGGSLVPNYDPTILPPSLVPLKRPLGAVILFPICGPQIPAIIKSNK